jgi:hypothetical protein
MAAQALSAEALLKAQLDDLTRFRDVIEAQRAVVRMENAGLLDSFSREAEDLAATVAAREVRLLAIRRAAQQHGDGREPAAVTSLAAQVDRARALASGEASELARQMEGQAREIAHELEATSRQLGQVLGGYSRQSGPGQPLLINRKA